MHLPPLKQTNSSTHIHTHLVELFFFELFECFVEDVIELPGINVLHGDVGLSHKGFGRLLYSLSTPVRPLIIVSRQERLLV